jgi:AcrR family transcriptional regulator
MARPLDHDKRRALAREAVALMQREGVDVSMTRLAEGLGLKRPTLLYHFPTRAHIVETALQEMMMTQAAFVLARIESETHPLRRLYAQVCAVHEFHHGNEARLVFLTQAIATTGGERMKAIVEGAAKIFEAHRRANADRIRAGIAAGTVAPCDPDALVQLVRAVTDGLMLQRVTEGITLEPVHTLLWENLLAPLERTATPSREPTTGVREAPPAQNDVTQNDVTQTDVTQNDARPRRSSPPASLSAASLTKRAHRCETTEEPRS